MKRILTAVVGICILFCGCGVIKDNNEVGSYVSTSKLDMSENTTLGRVEKAALYFLNETSGTLTAELRQLVIGQDVNPAEVAVESLLEGPSSDEGLQSVALEGMSLDYIEFSRDVANVYLLYEGEEMQTQQKYIFELALANTVTDILGAEYVCIFYNGMQTGFLGRPYAPIQKQTGSLQDAWTTVSAKYAEVVPIIEEESETQQTDESNQILDEGESTVNEITTVLYFVSADGEYILPEVRDVEYTDGNYIETLIEELKKGPQNTDIMMSSLADDLELNDYTLTEMDTGGYRLKLDFSELPTRYDFSDTEDAVYSYAAIIYTITGFVPEIDSVDIYVAGTQITSIDGIGDLTDGLQREDFNTGYIGSSASIYFADTDSDLLLAVSRSMEQEETWSAKARVLEILRGPLAGDVDNAWPVMPNGVTESDILSVDVYTDTAYVNVSQNFKDACALFSSQDEMLLVYSIVNTITAMDGINKVQFLVEGEQTDTLTGYLCIADPFLRNYGLIKETG